MGGADSVRRRQLRAGLAADVDRFRAEQVLWGALGRSRRRGRSARSPRRGMPGVVAVVMMTPSGSAWVSPAPTTCCPAGCPPRGADARPSSPRSQSSSPSPWVPVREPSARSTGSAGSRSGELAGELRRCLADARAGANLPTALQGLADRTGLPSLRRFVDGVVIAVQRGTPLADVLRAQAQDVREEGRRGLMEAGGRKEIAMMVPVVFLILPVTVLFAVFPGFTFFRFTL